MATYVLLLNFTQQGITDLKGTPNRIDAARKGIEAMGGNLNAIYFTMGQYDAIAIIEAPDDETATRISLATGALGNVRMQTHRAFSESEFRSLVADVTR